jgi:hypothetical protein
MRYDVIDSTVGIYTGDFGRGEGNQNGGFWTFIPRPKLGVRTHGLLMVTVLYADDGDETTAMTHHGNESVISAYIVESNTVVLRVSWSAGVARLSMHESPRDLKCPPSVLCCISYCTVLYCINKCLCTILKW